MPLKRGSAGASRAGILRHSALAWVVLFASVIVTFFAWRITTATVENSEEQAFLTLVGESNDAISMRMLDYQIALDSAVGLLRGSEDVTRAEWKIFAESLKLQTQFTGIQGLGYAVIVPPDAKPGFEKDIRAEGFPDFAINPADGRNFYTAILYLEPFDFRNQRAFGFDMYSEPTRREAMESAARTGLATVSGPVTLVQETDKDIQRGFLMYVPHYRSGAPIDTVKQRQDALVGWVYAAFRTGDLMDGVLPSEARDFFSEIFYGNDTATENLLYEGHRASGFEPERMAQTSMPIGNRIWTTRFTSDSTTSARSSQPWIVAGAGLVIDVLLFLVIASLALRRQRAEELALQMTDDLRTSNKSLSGFMQIVETTPDFVAIFDVRGGLQHLNRAWRALLGLTDNDPLPGHIDPLFESDALDQLREVAVPAALRDGMWSGESTLMGEDRPLEVSLTVLRHEGQAGLDGRRLSIVAHDITAYKNVERLKDEFVSTVSHELRTPLTSIHGSLVLLDQGAVGVMSEQAAHMLAIARRNTDRLIRLINDLLDLEKMQAGKMEMSVRPTDLRHLVEQAVSSVQSTAGAAGITLIIECPDDAPPVEVDADRMIQVLTNLLSNAIKFSPGNSTVTVSVRHHASDRCVELAVADQGSGISTAMLEAIFERFTQADSSAARAKGGTGLGLAIANDIVKLHGGSITATSSDGQGTILRVTLPLDSIDRR